MRCARALLTCVAVASLAFACAQRRAASLWPIADSSVGVAHLTFVVRPPPTTEPLATTAPAAAAATTTSAAGPFQRIGFVEGTFDSYCGLAPFSGDGSRFITELPRAVRVWSTTSLRPLTDPLPLSPADPYRLSADGRTVLTGTGEEIRLWDVATSRLRWSANVTGQHWFPACVGAADLSPDGQTVAALVTGDDFQLVIWRAGEPQPRCRLKDETGASVEFDPTGNWVVVYREVDGAFRVRSAGTGRLRCPEPREYVAHSAAPPRLATFDATARRLLLPTERGDFKIVDTATGQTIVRANVRPAAIVRRVRFCRGDSRVIVATERWGETANRLQVYNASTGQFEFEVPGELSDFDVDASGRWAVCCSPYDAPPVIELWDLACRTRVQSFPATKGESAHISPDGQTIVIEEWPDPYSGRVAQTAVWRVRRAGAEVGH